MDPEAAPDVAAEIARLLAAKGWTVRKLKAEGFGGRTADALLGKGDGLPSIGAADRALALLGRRLWHQRRAPPASP